MKQILILISLFLLIHTGTAQTPLHFDFGGNARRHLSVTPETLWPTETDGVTYGLQVTDGVETVQYRRRKARSSFLTSETPFYFNVALPEGNYRVTVTLGDKKGPSNTTIKAESRRLMVYDHNLEAGEIEEVTFMVSLRSARISGNDSIRLKDREFGFLNWDEMLTLEFGGDRPCVAGVSIEALGADRPPIIFLTGNSTVTDQDMEPWASWGQMFPVFFQPDIIVANYAESGETLRGFISERRLEKIETLIQPGDYLFMEFAHNDQKPTGAYVEPWTTYQEYLMKFANMAREHGATPVFVTSTQRRNFDENGQVINTLGDYPAAMRQLAEREGIALIDLNAMSETFYEALGVEESKKALVHFPANTFPRQEKALADNTHFSTYGAWQLAKCVVEGIRATDLPLNDHLVPNLPDYDPDDPDLISEWLWPLSPRYEMEKPDGN